MLLLECNNILAHNKISLLTAYVVKKFDISVFQKHI